MSQPVNTPGPVHVDGQNIIRHEAQVGIARVFGHIGQPREANARLLAAAYNAFDSAAKKLGCNAVELAESMQDGQIADVIYALRYVLPYAADHDCANEREIDNVNAILAKVMGGAV